ncbi:Topoisomerase 1-associated factor 1 [Polyrhizophydium stewartii]|uniref:Topoisomerase 1-associated factor 1 n=1 Tax=Polyrhizophydium stewartii TaxID=2732419 RepID=A0ABR4NH18_9FUNG
MLDPSSFAQIPARKRQGSAAPAPNTSSAPAQGAAAPTPDMDRIGAQVSAARQAVAARAAASLGGEQDPGIESELVVQVSFSSPIRGNKRMTTIRVLASQTLADLRDAFMCTSDQLRIDDEPDSAGCGPSFFFIENKFYVDLRSGAADPTVILRKWMQEDSDSFGIVDIATVRMETATLSSLWLSLGTPYLFTHHANCSHIVTFDQMHVFNPKIDPGKRQNYPLVAFEVLRKPPKCSVCQVFHASVATFDDIHTPESPALWCDSCFDEFHNDAHGNPLYTSFRKLPVLPAMIVEPDDPFDNHLLSVCAALGGFQRTPNAAPVYVPGDECLACLRDLKRFLRSAEQQKDRHVHDLLHKWRVVQNDLLPLLVASVRSDNLKTAVTVCEIMVPLTWPFNADGAPDFHDQLKTYQDAFLAEDVLPSMLAVMVHLFSVPFRQRSENDHARLRLFVTLIRNLLAPSDTQVAATVSAEQYKRSVLQERLVSKMQADGIVDLVMSICGSLSDEEFDGWNSLVAEIIFLIFHRRSVRDIVKKERLGSQLQDLIKKEENAKRASLQSRPSSRHSRFGGTFSIELPVHLAVSIKRDIDRERPHLKDPDFLRYIWLCQFALELRRMLCDQGREISVSSVLSVMTVPNLVFTIRRLLASRDEKNFVETTQCLRLLEQLLETVHELTMSSDDNLGDIANQLITTLFYEHDNAMLLRSLCKDPRNHTKSYLEALVACIDRLLNVTEKTVAQQGFLITRRKIGGRRKAVSQPSSRLSDAGSGDCRMYPDAGTSHPLTPDADSQGSDADESAAAPRFVERAFDFEHYVSGFASEATVQIYCQLLRYYPDISDATLAQILRMFKRLNFDQGRPDLFHKVPMDALEKEAPPLCRSPTSLQLSALTLLNALAGMLSSQIQDPLRTDFLHFVRSVVGALVERTTSDKSRGPLEIVKLLFGSVRSDYELSQAVDEDELRDSLSTTEFGAAAYMFWASSSIRQDLKEKLLEELQAVFEAAAHNNPKPTMSEIFTKLFVTSDEVQMFFEAISLDVDVENARATVSHRWSKDDLGEALKAIALLRTKKRARTTTKSSTRKKSKVEDPKQFPSAQFVLDSDEDDEQAFFEREERQRSKNSETAKQVAAE